MAHRRAGAAALIIEFSRKIAQGACGGLPLYWLGARFPAYADEHRMHALNSRTTLLSLVIVTALSANTVGAQTFDFGAPIPSAADSRFSTQATSPQSLSATTTFKTKTPNFFKQTLDRLPEPVVHEHARLAGDRHRRVDRRASLGPADHAGSVVGAGDGTAARGQHHRGQGVSVRRVGRRVRDRQDVGQQPGQRRRRESVARADRGADRHRCR